MSSTLRRSRLPSSTADSAPAASARRSPSALLLRDLLVHRLFHEGGLACSSIAQLTWAGVSGEGSLEALLVRAGTTPEAANIARVRQALERLHELERALGYGTPDSYVVRFRHGTDLVSRANGVLRLLRGVRNSPERPSIGYADGRLEPQ